MTERQQRSNGQCCCSGEPLNSLSLSLTPPLSLSLTPPLSLSTACGREQRAVQQATDRERNSWEQSHDKVGASLNDVINYESVFALKNRVFCLIAPNGWAIASQHFEGPYRLVFPSVAGTFLPFVGKKSPNHATQKRGIHFPQIITRCRPRLALFVFVRFLVCEWCQYLYADHLQSAVSAVLRETAVASACVIRVLLTATFLLSVRMSCVTSAWFLDNGSLPRDWPTLTQSFVGVTEVDAFEKVSDEFLQRISVTLPRLGRGGNRPWVFGTQMPVFCIS